MSTLTKSRRMPAQYRVRPGGVTEIVYNATPDVIVVLPGTRWLEQRREREARLAALREEESVTTQTLSFMCGIPGPVLETEAASTNFTGFAATFVQPLADTEIIVTEEEAAAAMPELADEAMEELSWTDRMRIATTKLMQRQAPWLPSMRAAQAL